MNRMTRENIKAYGNAIPPPEERTGHTPGPWEVRGIGVHAPGLRTVASLTCGDYPERSANARLIAAAPELLSFIKSWRETIVGNPANYAPESWERMFHDEAMAIIASAEGDR